MSLYSTLRSGEGVATPPLEPSYSHYIVGRLHTPDNPARPFMILTNGTLQLNDETTVRNSALVGTAMLPIFPVVLDDVAEEKKVGSYFNRLEHITGVKWSGENRSKAEISDENYLIKDMFPIEVKPVGRDINEWMVKTYAEMNEIGITTWTDPRTRYMTWSNDWFMLAANQMQEIVTRYTRALPEPYLQIVGYAELSTRSGKLVKQQFPSDWVQVGHDKRNRLYFHIDRDPMPPPASRQMAFYLGILACMIRRLTEIEGYVFADYVAVANSLLSEFVQTGNPSFDRWYNAMDIIDRVQAMIGVKITEENRFLFRDDGSWELMFHLWVTLGFVVARCVPMTAPATCYSTNAIRYTLFNTCQRMFGANWQDLSGRSLPMYLMPSNIMKPNRLMLPCMVREQDFHDVQYVNKYLQPRKWVIEPKLRAVEVRRGEINEKMEDPSMLSERVWLKFIAISDARRETHTFAQSIITEMRFPYDDHDPDGKVDDESRRLIYFLNLFCGSSDSLKLGYTVTPGLQLIGGLKKIRYYVAPDWRLKAKVDGETREVTSETVDVTAPVKTFGEKPQPDPKTVDEVIVHTEEESLESIPEAVPQGEPPKEE